MPGVNAASIVNVLPLSSNDWGARIVGETGTRTDLERPLRVNFTEASPGYFKSIGIPLHSGRDFTDSDAPGGQSVVIVNRSLAKTLWPGEDPLGKRIKTVNDERKLGWRTVVGVVADIPQNLEDDERTNHSMFCRICKSPTRA
jgi:putative ABC transport system permease protein